MKFSPNGQKIAICNSSINSELLDFNTSNGIVSNAMVLHQRTSLDGFDYGAEFSPDNSKLYLTYINDPAKSDLVQFDLNASNIPASSQIIYSNFQSIKFCTALQVAPNGKIYVGTDKPFLSVINNPNGIGNNCNFMLYAIDLVGRESQLGLPSFVSSFFYSPSIIVSNPCQNQATQFQVANATSGNTVAWDFGDGTTGGGITASHTYTIANNYTVTVAVTSASGTVTNTQAVTVFAEPTLLSNAITLKQCDDNTDGFSVFNLNEAKSALVGTRTGLVISFHKTQANAQNNVLPITNPTQYTNTLVSNDVIFVRVQNANGCYKTAQINLEVSTTQIQSTFAKTITECDNAASGSITDGIATFDFSAVKQEVQNLFPSNQLLEISFYKNLANALSETNPINNINSYSNIGSPNNQDIWIRVDSQTNNDCLRLGQYLKLVVDRIPIVQPKTLTECDDNQDGLVAFDTTNLESNVLNGLTNVVVTYSDANNNTVAITNPFVTNSTILNVKVKNTFGKQCEYNSTINFVMSKLPQVFPISASLTTTCDDEINPAYQNGQVAFDTSNFANTILGNQTNMLVNYYDQNNNPITLTNPFLSGTQNIKVEIVNSLNTNCKTEGTINFVANKVPKIDLTGDELVCSNNPNFTKIINAGLIDISTANNFAFEWFLNDQLIPNQNSYTLTVNTAGIYKAKVTNNFGCSRTRMITVKASEIAKIDNVIVTDLSDINIVIINASGLGTYEYSLDGIFYQDSNSFNNISAGIYKVYVRDKKGCGIAEDEVNVLGIPSFFTPNGDSYNDYWNIKGINKRLNTNTTIEIFDRFGKLLYQLNALSQGWDGTINNQPMPSDDYWYVISLQDNRTLKGHFSLKR